MEIGVFRYIEKDQIFNNDSRWTQIDLRNYGRCFSINPDEKMKENVIASIHFQFKKKVRIYFHTPGVIYTLHGEARKYVELEKDENVFVDVEHEVHEFLDYKGRYCEADLDYNYDNCRLKNNLKVRIA